MHLSLEPFAPEHIDDYLRLVGDARVMAMITERAIAADEARRDFQQVLATNALAPGFGQFRVVDPERGHFIGLAKLELAAHDTHQAELGYMLLPAYWGQGIASQLAATLIARARAHPQLTGLYAIIDPANLASRKILIRHGFVSQAFRDFDGLPGEVLALAWPCPPPSDSATLTHVG